MYVRTVSQGFSASRVVSVALVSGTLCDDVLHGGGGVLQHAGALVQQFVTPLVRTWFV